PDVRARAQAGRSPDGRYAGRVQPDFHQLPVQQRSFCRSLRHNSASVPLHACSKQRLFQDAWKELYPGIIQWVSLSSGGKVTKVDPATMTAETDFAKHQPAVAN